MVSCNHLEMFNLDLLRKRLSATVAFDLVNCHFPEAGALKPDSAGNMRGQEDIRKAVKGDDRGGTSGSVTSITASIRPF